jgi:hypothetical protein
MAIFESRLSHAACGNLNPIVVMIRRPHHHTKARLLSGEPGLILEVRSRPASVVHIRKKYKASCNDSTVKLVVKFN